MLTLPKNLFLTSRLLPLFCLLLVCKSGAADLDMLIAQTQSASVELAVGPEVNSIRPIFLQSQPNSEKFLRYIQLGQWTSAFRALSEETELRNNISANENFLALRTFLLIKLGANVAGLEDFFHIKDVDKIYPGLVTLVRDLVPITDPAWQFAQVQWAPGFEKVFGPQIEFRSQTRTLLGGDLDLMISLAAKLPLDSPERSLLTWQIVMHFAKKSELGNAGKTLASMIGLKNSPIGLDLINLTAARFLYENGNLKEAVEYYQKISKSSDYWLEAQEETSWAYLRLKQFANAIAVTEQLTGPLFEKQTGAELFFVRAYSQVKVCEYSAASKTIEAFSKEFRERAKLMETLAKSPKSKEVEAALKLIGKIQPGSNKSVIFDLGSLQSKLPRYFAKDEELIFKVREEGQIAKEVVQLKAVGDQEQMESFEKRKQSLQTEIESKISLLAGDEAREIKTILRKMHILEAEILQQLYLLEKKPGTLKSLSSNKISKPRSKDVLFFPGGDIWADEIGFYQVDLKKVCSQSGVVQ